MSNWEKSTIWYSLSENLPWSPGIVLSCTPLLSSTCENKKTSGEEWIFIIIPDDDKTSSNDHVSITTRPLDSYYLEFQHIKRRDQQGQQSGIIKEITDMTSLSFLNEPEMIECLRIRYENQIIYTNIGPILIAVNPFEQLNDSVYSLETIKKYFQSDPTSSRQYGPHVFQVSNAAYKKMFIDKYDASKRENQAILVNGESGAGKTESTKQVLRYLAVNSSQLANDLGIVNENEGDIEALINAVNPITESFGNAKTSRNNNSSRFGKFIELCYSASGYIIGAHIQTYLLETIRVISQVKGERNYHIFYEVFTGLSDQQRQDWSCQDLTNFHYLNQSQEYKRYDGESDFDNFSRVFDALRTINLSIEQINWIFQIVVSILHLGNIQFVTSKTVGDDAALFCSNSSLHVSQVCKLLSIDDTSLATALTKRGLKVAGNYILKNLNVENAIIARDTYAKTLYDLLFKSLLSFINTSLSLENNSSQEDEQASSIGVLDIFGFEYFEKNSFEQLCINFANEKLQDHFNHSIFKSEQEVYQEEGIKWNFTNYPDNSERLELFEHKRTGIFLLCDEQLKIPKPSDEKLVKSFYAKCITHPYFTSNKAEQIKNEFVIHHFACVVKYQIEGFVDKNRNDVGQEIYDSLELSTNEFTRNLLLQCEDKSYAKRLLLSRDVGNGNERNSLDFDMARERTNSKIKSQQKSNTITKRAVSIISHFSTQLNDLVMKIRSMRSHFIRCIKPNNTLLARSFDYVMVQTQLRCGGALGAVQVFHAGFPNRMEFKYFVTRYTCFLTVCGTNILTQDLLKCIHTAKSTGLDELWRAATSMLLDIISLTIIILYKTENFEIPEGVDVITGLQMGKTQVFLRASVFELLERLQYQSQIFIAKILQRHRRAVVLSRKYHTSQGQQLLKSSSSSSSSSPEKSSSSSSLVTDSLMLRYHALHSHHFIISKRKFQARNCISATIILQRKIRMYLAILWRKRVIRGVTRLKARYRGGKARRLVYEMKLQAAIAIQTLFRQFFMTKRYLKKKFMTIVIQKYLRRYFAQRQKKLKLVLILKLQCLWRGTMARIRTVAYRQKLKQAALEAQRRAAEAKADFMANLDDKLKSNPNLLFDMLGASEKIALLSRQNEALLHANKMMDLENSELREKCNQLEIEITDLKSALPIAVSTTSSIGNERTNADSGDGDCNSKNNNNKDNFTAISNTNSNSNNNSDVVSIPNAVLVPTLESDNHTSRYLQQILYIAKQGEKDLSQLMEKFTKDCVDHQLQLQENETILAQLSTEYQQITQQIKEIELQANPSSTGTPSVSRHPLERALSLPSLFTPTSGENSATSAPPRTLSSFGRFASRLSLGPQETTPDSTTTTTTTGSEPENSHKDPVIVDDIQKEQLEQLNQTQSQKISDLTSQETLCANLREKFQQLEKIRSGYRTDTNKLRQIILFLNSSSTTSTSSTAEQEESSPMAASSSSSSVPELVHDSEALWAMKNLNMKNAALAEELRSVKHRFSAVIGRMEGFSLSKFTMNVLGGDHSTNNESALITDSSNECQKETLQINEKIPAVETIQESFSEQQTNEKTESAFESPLQELAVELLFPSPPSNVMESQLLEEQLIPVEPIEMWKPSFVCAVSQWSRKSRREVVFILRVRHVGVDIRDWSVIKTFPDFKSLRAKLKQFISGSIDSLFPADGMTLFSISDDVAEERKEGLNSYLVALCGGNHISLGDPACELIEEFLCIDEYVNMDRIFARDAGLIITAKEVNLL